MKTALYSILTILLISSSCQKEPTIRFGFDTEFDENSQGLTIMTVNNSAEEITLTGEVFVSDGEVLIELIAPSEEVVFSSKVSAANNLYANESYQAISGNWKLKYKSLDGVGSMDLHLQIVN